MRCCKHNGRTADIQLAEDIVRVSCKLYGIRTAAKKVEISFLKADVACWSASRGVAFTRLVVRVGIATLRKNLQEYLQETLRFILAFCIVYLI